MGVIARPDPSDVETFCALGRPRLAFLVAGGAIDSMVCKYTANRKIRSEDEYAPGGDPSLCRGADGTLHAFKVNGKDANARPDKAVIAYSGRCREAYKGVPVIAGGLEASLRRLSHYDYLSDTVRKPIILDAKADLVIYGMAERAIAEVAGRLASVDALASAASSASASALASAASSASASAPAGAADAGGVAAFDPALLRGIRGTVWRTSKEADVPAGAIRLPDHEKVAGDPRAFAESFAEQYRNTDPGSARPLYEAAAGQFAVQEPPQAPLSRAELDAVYDLHFERSWHPVYDRYKGVPALAEVKFSIASSRGCYGACAFCALAFHQGRIVSSRSKASIVAEARELTRLPDFKGYIHDIGGPTANFRGPACRKQAGGSACVDRRCLAPEPCPALEVDHRDFIDVLRAVRAVPGVKKAFVRSGLRFDYVMADSDGTFLRELAEHHVSGQLKVAPEHVSERVLRLMGKPPKPIYDAFAKRWAELNAELGLKQYIVPYFIASHPGSELSDAIELAEYLRDSGFVPDQVQDFYPTPGTLATAMYRSGLDPLTMEPVYVARGARDRSYQRALLQYNKPENRSLVLEALRLAGRTDLIGHGPKCLVS
ncbi:MAG: YgiQ family radical SAM protein [Spirochaetae bacterium HGW-Spirochaetae-7]|nr:MAG: YgiQ family radical SAM protein [Spirochaetae bacterium HGW-Spirochaetae-7]